MTVPHQSHAERVRDGSEVNAQLSARVQTPLPADLDARLEERMSAHDKVFLGTMEQPDPDIDGVLLSAPGEVRRVVGPYLDRLAAIQSEYRSGTLTGVGEVRHTEAVKSEIGRVLDEQVFDPLNRRLEAAATRYTEFLKPPVLTDKDRAGATALAAELRLLSPTRGVSRVAEVLRDAAARDEFNVVRALIPFLRSLIEDKATSWYGNETAFALAQKAEGAVRTWREDVGEERLAQIGWLQYQLSSLRQAAVESSGNIDKSTRFLVSDFKAGRLRLSTPPHTSARRARYDHIRQAADRAARAAHNR